ncbi:hypothetical protein Sjap_009401 [Stephania japonica]|uniref:Uncharacterized protein n=1 Tax=Stephania japonica TaxID=461633 RepID=A0AAP0JRD8_9MAGN
MMDQKEPNDDSGVVGPRVITFLILVHACSLGHGRKFHVMDHIGIQGDFAPALSYLLPVNLSIISACGFKMPKPPSHHSICLQFPMILHNIHVFIGLMACLNRFKDSIHRRLRIKCAAWVQSLTKSV